MSSKIKKSLKFTTRFKKMAFGGDPDSEFLSHEVFFDINGNTLTEIKYDSETLLPETNYFEYDAMNRLLSHKLEIEHDGIGETYTYSRDEKGRVLEELKIYGDDPGEKIVYEYMAHDYPVKVSHFDADGEPESVEEIAYNEKDLPVKVTKHNFTNDQNTFTTIEYNEKEKPVHRETVDENGKTISEVTFTYHPDGNLHRVIEKNSDGKVVSDTQSFFDVKNNLIERRVKDFHSRTLKFVYDDNDRCTEETMLDENGNMVMKNTFEYDEAGRLVSESGYYTDMNRSQEGANTVSRYEYEFHAE